MRTSGFAVNIERSERGVVAVGVLERVGGAVIAGISLAMPSIRYEPEQLPSLVGTLRAVAQALEADLAGA